MRVGDFVKRKYGSEPQAYGVVVMMVNTGVPVAVVLFNKINRQYGVPVSNLEVVSESR